MSSNARRKGSPETRSSNKGVTTMKTSKARVFVFLTLVTLTAVFSANALTATATAATADTAVTQQSGFIASSFNNILSFFGLAAETVKQSGDKTPPVLPDDTAANARANAAKGAGVDGNAGSALPGGCDQVPEGLLACYQADDNANDAKGSHNGQWSGRIGYASGKVGAGSFNFNGTSRIDVPNAEDLNPNAITVDGWVNLSDVEGKFGLISKGNAFSLSVRGGQLVFASRNLQGDVESVEAPGTLKAGEWVYVAATHDGFNRRIFVNGEEVISDTQNGFYGANEDGLVIGAAETNNKTFSALADEVKMFGRSLSPDEIKGLFDKGLSTDRADAVNGAITFTAGATQMVTEGDVGQANLSINFTRAGSTNAGNMTVSVTPTGGTTQGASANCGIGDDYVVQPNPVVVTWGIGQTVASFGIGICGDTVPEGPESFTVTITNVTAAGDSGVGQNQVVTINDQDAAASISSVVGVAPSSAGTNATLENPGFLFYTFTRTPGTPNAFTLPVNYTRTTGGFNADDGNDGTTGGDDFDIDFGSTTGGGTACTAASSYSNATNSGVAVIPAGSASCQLRVVPLIDSRVEPNETVILTVAAGSYTIGTPSSGTGIIQNDDFSTVFMDADSILNGDEGNPGAAGFVTFDPIRMAPANSQLQDLNVRFEITGTATCQTTPDYTIVVNGTNRITQFACTGPTTGRGVFTLQGDELDPTDLPLIDLVADTRVEPDETITFTILAFNAAGVGLPAAFDNSNTYTLGAPLAATATINDDDETITVDSPVVNSPISEAGPGGLQFGINRVFNSAGVAPNTVPAVNDPLTVSFSLSSLTPTSTQASCTGSDYTVTSGSNEIVAYNPANCTGTITFVALDVAGTILVTPVNDIVPENDETLTLTITGGTVGSIYGIGPVVGPDGTVSGTATANATILNDDVTVSIQVSPASVNEGSTLAPDNSVLTYTFTRIGQTATPTCANFTTSGAGASALTDYTTSFGAVNGPIVPCVNSFTANAGASPGVIGIPIGTGGPQPANGVQANIATFIVNPTDDDMVEPNEEVQIQVNPGAGYTPTAPNPASGLILNDDSQRVSVAVSGNVAEGNTTPASGPGQLTYTFTRTQSDGNTLSVTYNVGGTVSANDFQNPPFLGNNVISFPAGAPGVTQTVNLVISSVPDNTVEANETVVVTVLDGTGYTAFAPNPATGMFLNDDNDIDCTGPTGGAALTPTVVNEGGSLTFSCQRTTLGSAAALPLTVSFTVGGSARFGNSPGAGDPNDYTIGGNTSGVAANGSGATGQLNFAAGNSIATVVINSTNDTVVEPDETVTVTFPANGQDTVNFISQAGSVPAQGNAPQGFDLTGTSLGGTITNNDNTVAVGVSVTDPDAAGDTVFESGDRELRYTFSRVTDGTAATLPLSINFTITGTACRPTVVCPAGGQGVDSAAVDYAVIFPVGTTGTYDPATGLGTIVIPANLLTASFIADPVDDQTPELPTPESVVVTINAQNPVVSTSTYTITTASATGFIANDDTSFVVAATFVTGLGDFEGNDNTSAPHGVVPENSGFGAPDNVTGLTPHGSHAVFTVTRTGDTSTTQRIDISTIPTGTIGAGTAISGLPNTPCGTPGVDYITDGRTLEFTAGVTTRRFFVAVCGDLTFENNETINVQLTNPAPSPVSPFSVTIPVATATWTIINDDGAFNTPSQFFVRPTNVTVTEGTTVNFQVCLYAANPSSATGGATLVTAGADIFFDDTIFDGTAISPGDYAASFTDPLNPLDDTVIPAGQSCSANIAAPTVDDNLFEGDETFFIQVSNVNAGVGNVNPIIPSLGTNAYPAGGTIPAVTAANNPFPGRGRAIILDNEAQNTFTISDVAQAEGNGGDNATTFNHVLIKNGEAAINQLVCWVTENGNSALPGGGPNPAIGGPNASGLFDYTSIITPNCYQFVPNGPTNVNVPVVINGDLFFENNDTYTVRLVTINGNPGGAAFLSNSSHANDPNYAGLGIGTIQNDDATPIVSIDNRPNALETDAAGNAGQFNIPVTFTLTGASAVATSLTYTVTTPGLNPTGGTAAGANVGPLPPTTPPVGFVACTGTIDLYAQSTGSSASPVSLSTTNVNGTVTVNGSTTINLIGCGDLRPETNETFTVTITSATNAVVAATTTACQTAANSACGTKSGFIIDNDVVGPFNFTDANGLTNGDVALAEGSTVGGFTPFTFLVRYQGVPADFPITVTYETSDGTAQDGNPAGEDNDYIARNNVSGNPCVVTFPAGSNAAQPCVIQVRQDSVQEIDETFSLLTTRIDGTGINVIGNNASGVPIVFGPTYNTPVNPAPPGTDLTALGTILNDDGSRVFSVTALSRLEGTVSPYDGTSTTAFVQRIEAQGSSNLVSTVNYRVNGFVENALLTARGGANCSTADSSTTGTDFINLAQAATGVTGGVGTTTGTVTFQPTGSGTGAGFDFVDVIIPVCADTRQEGDETYQVALTAVTNGSIAVGSANNGLGTIRNDDGVSYSLVTSTININEGNGLGDGNTSNATITLVKTGTNNVASTVGFFTSDGSAIGAANCSLTPTMGNPDYRSSGTSASPAAGPGYAAGATGNVLIQIPICGDTFAENNESFTVTIRPSDGAELTAIVNILNDDGVPPVANGVEGDIVDALGGSGGDGFVLANDVSAIRQYILGNGAPVTTPNQFQRADVNLPCGNGQIDAGDVTVIRQMILGTVANNTPACGPTVPGGAPTTDEARPDVVARIIRAVNTQTVAGATVVVPFQIDAVGDEVSAAFTVNFNSAVFTYVSTAPGAGLPANTVVNVNATQAAQGRLGVLIDGTTAIPTGTRQILLVTFTVAQLPAGVAGTYPVTFSGTPVAQSVSNIGGTLLTTTYEPGNIVISPSAAGVSVSGRVTTPNGQGLRNATVVLTDSEGNRRTATTGSFGIYTFDDVEAGQSYVVSVATKRFRFTSRIVNVDDSLADVDFAGQE